MLLKIWDIAEVCFGKVGRRNKKEVRQWSIETDDVIYPIESTKAPIIQLDFESYIGYSVINELFTSWDDYERFEGKKTFRIYSKSRFLDYISNATFASQYPGPYLHYGIVCLDHIVNVVTISEPKVREINRQ